MDATAWIALAIFAISIVVVVSNKIDGTITALVGVAAMIWFGVMTEVDAFGLVDWNVMAILISIWIIAGYFGKSGVPSWLSVQALRLSGGHPGLLVMILSVLATCRRRCCTAFPAPSSATSSGSTGGRRRSRSSW